MSVRSAYQSLLTSGEISPDPQQDKAVKALQRLLDDLATPKKLFARKKMPLGIYLYGGVGRGKSMLMDLFFAQLPGTIKARRLHFHEFMLETHDWLHKARAGGEDDILPAYAKAVSKQTDILCFDEFHVVDVADAMILSRLFTALINAGLVLVATSNWPPDRLYENGLQRVRFLPFIELVKTRMEIIHLGGDTDYREQADGLAKNYFYPLGLSTDRVMDDLFAVLTGGKQPSTQTLTVKGREIEIQAAGKIARATFAQLCEQPHAAEDYMAIAKNFDTLFIDHIPVMNYDRRNEIKRLMTLIDVLYDRSVKVVISAEAPPDKLYRGKDHAFEFERTISRLTEMQGQDYFNK